MDASFFIGDPMSEEFDASKQLEEFSQKFEQQMQVLTDRFIKLAESSTQNVSKLIDEKISESEKRMQQLALETSTNPDAARVLRVKELNKRFFTLSEALTLAQYFAEANQKGQVSPDDILNMVERVQPMPRILPEVLQQ